MASSDALSPAARSVVRASILRKKSGSFSISASAPRRPPSRGIPGVGAGLVHGAFGRDERHEIGPARRRPPPGVHRRSPSESDEIGAYAVASAAPPFAARKPHMTSSKTSSAPYRSHRERKPRGSRDAADHAVVPDHRLDDRSGDRVPLRSKCARTESEIAVPRETRVGERGRGNAGRVGHAESRRSGAGLIRNGSAWPVIAPLELHVSERWVAALAPRGARSMVASVPVETKRMRSAAG
jgi:hypothetical protein